MKRLIKIASSIALILFVNGCEYKNKLTKPVKPKYDESIRPIDSSNVKYISDMTQTAFEWQRNDDANAYGYYIYRADMQSQSKFKRIARIKNKYTTHYVDNELEPNTQYLYAFSVRGYNDMESHLSSSIPVQTLPLFNSVSFISAVSSLPKQIKILWRPHDKENVQHYIIERKSPTDTKWKTLKKVEGRYQAEYIDDGLKDNEIFLYRIKAVTFDKIISHPSDIVKAKTKPLPKAATNLKATTHLPKKIELSWNFSKTEDVVSYNIYTSSDNKGRFKLLANIKSSNNAYAHLVNKDGKIMFYKITSIDKDGLETDKSLTPIMGSTLAKPNKPTITLAQIQGEKAILNWISNDDRTVAYNIYKTISEGWGESKKIKIRNITDLRYEDRDITRGVEYKYTIQAVDEFGLVSEETAQTSLTLPKLQEE